MSKNKCRRWVKSNYGKRLRFGRGKIYLNGKFYGNVRNLDISLSSTLTEASPIPKIVRRVGRSGLIHMDATRTFDG